MDVSDILQKIDLMQKIKIDDISLVLRKNFKESRLNKFFEVDSNYSFNSELLKLTVTNSIKIDFYTNTKEPKFNLLLILSLCNEENYSHKLLNELKQISERNIDKILIWSINDVPTEVIEALKSSNSSIICLSYKEISDIYVINNFFPIDSNNYEYAVLVNKVCNLIIKRLYKFFHLVLSEIAAPTYNTDYGKTKIATNAIMQYEEKILRRVISRRRYLWEKNDKYLKIAVDVGCGTGRHSFILSSDYDEVYGFDFSPKMIEESNKEKKMKNIENTIFSVSDLEYENIVYESKFKGEVDLIVASFGMGSFIENTPKILRRYYEWLRPGGELFISFYNRNSILLQLIPNWRDTSLSAHLDVDNSTLSVRLSPDIVFQIYCKPYDEKIHGMISKIFEVNEIFTYPTTMALLPNSLLQDPKAFEIFSKIDNDIAQDTRFNSGHYVIAIAKKLNPDEPLGYKTIIKLLKEYKANYEILTHDLVLSMDDVKKILGEFKGCMIKTIIFKDRKNEKYIVVSLSSEKRVDKNSLIEYLNKHFNDWSSKVVPRYLQFATEREVLGLGFPIGGISPLGINIQSKYEVIKILDEDLIKSQAEWLYMGIGDNKKTLKIKKSDFVEITKDYFKMII